MHKHLHVLIATIVWQWMIFTTDGFADDVSFSRDVLPILSDRCFHCHGPDESNRQASLRLDVRDDALSKDNGKAAIVPHQAAQSELMLRIVSSDPDHQMPPPKSHRKPLSEHEVETLKRWIDQGAVWGKHWAFEIPQRPKLAVSDIHPIDSMIRRRQAAMNFVPSPPADRRTLLRRVSFDLTGLPPTYQEVASFESDTATDAYERHVDRLLASDHFGERMAMWWLDVSRYSDTDGFQQDATRTNWPWRDWVVQAFQNNMPFDQFTLEQFAGDLLPDATAEQKLATCFHRNHMTNGEGGRDPEESRIDYVIDRVNTTGTAFLGLTLGCCQCHSHKFDPISQHEYYSFFAFFNSIDEDGKAGTAAKPYLKYQSPFAKPALAEAQSLVEARTPIATQAKQKATKEFEEWVVHQCQAVAHGFEPWHVISPSSVSSVEGTTLLLTSDGVVQASGRNPIQDDYRVIASIPIPRVTGLRLEVFAHGSHTDGKLSRGKSGEFILTDIKVQVRRRGYSQIRDIEVTSAVADVERKVKAKQYGLIKDTLDDDPRNGWTTEGHSAFEHHTAVFELAEPLVLEPDEELIVVMLHRSTDGDANIGRFRWSVTDQRGACLRSLEPMPLQALAAFMQTRAAANAAGPGNAPESIADAAASFDSLLDEKLRGRLLDQFLTDHAEYQRAKQQLDSAKKQFDEIKKAAQPVDVMVLSEMEQPRTSHVLDRGVWDKKGDAVLPGLPKALVGPTARPAQNRLDLAKWLVSSDNPLTARVLANHLWQLCFGQGLVRTPEDFGLQGELPTHPDVLDWLAVELIESGWNIKHVLKLIVSTQTYQQSSRVRAEDLQHDPHNKYLARGARFRLPSWMLRDAALRASGLLNPKLGGPPVMPYQPEGVWAEITMGRFGYDASQGTAQYRRTLYAFWRRSSAPTFLFDSAQRRTCEVRPLQTNTPLHALTLLNDSTILECSKAIAIQVVSEHADLDSQITTVIRRILNRNPSSTEQERLRSQYQLAYDHYRDHPSDADKMLDFGQPELNASIEPKDRSAIASMLLVASLLFNLDEAVTHD
jgi:hypothetical protein